MTARVEHLVTSGTFELDGGSWEVDNNVWLIGDDDEVLVIDAAHDADVIAAVVGNRRLDAIIASIRDRPLTIPADTAVHTGHGASTSIGAEAPHLDDWIARGH